MNNAAHPLPIEKICAELAWVNETPDPTKCGCRHLRCCEETGHKPGACSGACRNEVLDVPVGILLFRDLLFRRRQRVFIAFDLLFLNGRDLPTHPTRTTQ